MEDSRTRAVVPINLTIEYEWADVRWWTVYARILLFLKWLFVLPVYVVVALYGVFACIAVFFAFWAILFTGRYPHRLFNFVRHFLEFLARTYTYFPLLLTNHWELDDNHPLVLYAEKNPEPYSRMVLLFLKLPSFVFGIGFGLASIGFFLLIIFAIPSWLVILVTGRYPRHWFWLNTLILEWYIRVLGWQFLLRDNASLFGTTGPVKAIVIVVIIGLIVNSVFNWSPTQATNWSMISAPGLSNAGLFYFTTGSRAERAKIDGEAILGSFVQAGVQSNVDAAMSLLVVKNETRSQVKGLFNFPGLFQGYEGLETTGWRWEKSSFPGMETLNLQGNIRYLTGPDGSFQATLLKDGKSWKISGVQLDR